MKKLLLATALLVVSASAMADRMVSGSHGGRNLPWACEFAKNDARDHARSGEHVTRFSRCTCNRESAFNSTCNVDATLSSNDRAPRMVTGTKSMRNEAIACDFAKKEAANNARSGEQVESYSECSCVKDDENAATCNVDALLEKVH
jgi:hypothetical protein